MQKIFDAAKILEELSVREQENKTTRKDRYSRCLYCHDKGYINIRLDYYLAKEIPFDVVPEIAPGMSNTAVKCDCNPESHGAFANIFGKDVFSSNLGKAINRARHSPNEVEGEEPF